MDNNTVKDKSQSATDKEAILVALDQLNQTMEVMAQVVARLKRTVEQSHVIHQNRIQQNQIQSHSLQQKSLHQPKDTRHSPESSEQLLKRYHQHQRGKTTQSRSQPLSQPDKQSPDSSDKLPIVLH